MKETVRLWSQDYSEVLFTTEDLGAAKQFFRDSSHDWLPIVIDYGTDWQRRWSGRLERENGEVAIHQNIEYIKYITAWPVFHSGERPMTDPAVEAAQRAVWQMTSGAQSSVDVRVAARVAAREALKPIREVHRPTGWGGECVVCFDSEGRGRQWPCDTAKLIYTTEELENDQ